MSRSVHLAGIEVKARFIIMENGLIVGEPIAAGSVPPRAGGYPAIAAELARQLAEAEAQLAAREAAVDESGDQIGDV